MTTEAAIEQLNEDEHTALTERDRASRAKRLLNDPLLVAAFADIREGLLREFEHSGPHDALLRESAWRAVRLLDKIKAHIATHLQTGQLAEARLAEIEDTRKKMGFWKHLRKIA